MSQRHLPKRLRKEDKDWLKAAFDTSHFDLNAILRGMQLTLVGAHRALQNPALFTNDHYRQAGYAVLAGVVIRLLIAVPIWAIKLAALLVSVAFKVDTAPLTSGLNFIADYVLQVPLFFMALMRHLVPTLDYMFMSSLKWVDITYAQKHAHDADQSRLRGPYYQTLRQYPIRASHGSMATASAAEALTQFVLRFARRSGISLAIFLLSYVPYVGRLVLPAASFYTFNRAVGLGPACVIFGSGLFLPRRYLVMFLQAYFASRSLTRELLDPYLSRVQFTPDQKRAWFHAREGILFGFGVGFWILLRIPLVGVLIYGIAEASTAYLITKITDPPPPPSQREAWAQTQTVWRNKHEFLSRSLWHLDDDNNHDGGHTTPTAQPPPPDEPPSYEEAMRTSATASGYDAAAAAELRER